MSKHPVPKRKTSKPRTSRRYNKFVFETVKKLQGRVNLTTCTNCGEKRLTHHACGECGFYRGRQVLFLGNDDSITTIKA
jgi:large subunit ribosomal protein L32